MNANLLDMANKRLDDIKKESAKLMDLTSRIESLMLVSNVGNKRIYIADENMKKPIDIAAVLDCSKDVDDITGYISGIINERIKSYEKELMEILTP